MLHHRLRVAQAAGGAFGHDFGRAREIGAREFDPQRGGVLRRCARRLVPGIGTMSSPCASTHASASWPACTPSLRRLADPLDEVQVLLRSSRPGSAGDAAVVVGREVVELSGIAGQEAAAERAVGDEADAELAARWQHLVPPGRGSRASTRSAAR